MMQILFALAAVAMGSPQSVVPATPSPQKTEPERPSDDIVVTGLRDLNDPESAVTHATLGSSRSGPGAAASREVYALAERFAKCAMSDSAALHRDLRLALDGRINGAGQRFAQKWLIMKRSGCAQDSVIARTEGIAVISQKYDTSYYERGALYIEAIKRFAPDLTLTARETGDAAVQARFNAREIPLARFRLPVDRKYFETAVCLVRLQPKLALRLVQTADARSVAELEAAVVNRAKICVGNAKRVYFDPSQFRLYIADAVYRWAVAARGVETLIPDN